MLRLLLRNTTAALFLFTIAASPAAQTPPTFSVASVKPSAPPSADGRMFVDYGTRPGGQWFSQNVPFIAIVRAAYPEFPLPGQIVGGPAWVNDARFDINARAEREVPPDVMTSMLRQLLGDRFSLKVRPESREMDVYALVVARPDGRLGPGLTQSTADCEAVQAARKKAAGSGAPPPPSAPKPGAKPECGMLSTSMNCVQRIATGGLPIGALTTPLQATVGRPVVDRTGLTGRWDVELQFACAAALQVATDRPDAPVSVFTAAQEQLGLRLEPRRERMDVLVIDSATMPSPD
jgi:uncharacterized protein (TIGR03435 family)